MGRCTSRLKAIRVLEPAPGCSLQFAAVLITVVQSKRPATPHWRTEAPCVVSVDMAEQTSQSAFYTRMCGTLKIITFFKSRLTGGAHDTAAKRK